MKSFTLRIRVLLIIGFLLSSCNSEIKNKNQAIFSEILHKSKENIFDEDKIIELETNKESVVSFPFDMCIVNKHFIISSKNNTIKVFDENGRFLGSVNTQGKVPGEYEMINAIFPYRENAFGIFDFTTSRVTLFTLLGNTIRYSKINLEGIVNYRSIVSLDGSIYFHKPYVDKFPYYVYVTDSLFKFSQQSPAYCDGTYLYDVIFKEDKNNKKI
ncbi:MAG: hypothetical protein CR986_07680 [Ignavibacteriae bacterium]|nr:MAG: hypothetical protein CR986_07680 [Ignavibacteriota bacterium]